MNDTAVVSNLNKMITKLKKENERLKEVNSKLKGQWDSLGQMGTENIGMLLMRQTMKLKDMEQAILDFKLPEKKDYPDKMDIGWPVGFNSAIDLSQKKLDKLKGLLCSPK